MRQAPPVRQAPLNQGRRRCETPITVRYCNSPCASQIQRIRLRRAAGMNILKSVGVAATLDSQNAEEELNSVLKHEKEDREAKARTVRSRLIQNLLRLKKLQSQKASDLKAKLLWQQLLKNSILSLKNNLEEKIVMSNKTIEFAKSKGQKVGDEDQKIVGDLVAREKNASRVYANASQVKNKTTMDYLLEKQALNRTEEELKTLVPQDSTGSTGGVEITGPTGSMSGSTDNWKHLG